MYSKCNLCPRECNIDRTKAKGFCCATDKLYVARAALHEWEEPCISGETGSGTVFFSNCNLKCVFCQNYNISHESFGKEITTERLSEIFLELQSKCANNINLVTPTHYIPHIIEAITKARKNGLVLPIVYNSSGYEKVETIQMLKGYVDIYLPDFKYFDDTIATKYSSAPNYFLYADKAIEEMVNQVGEPVFNNDGIMTKGVIIRHLILPDNIIDSKKIIKHIYDKYKNKVYISIMNQYTPIHQLKYSELNRTLSNNEYEEVIDYAISIGVENGFIQEGETAKESFIPAFDTTGV